MISSSSYIVKLWLLGAIALILAADVFSISHEVELDADHHIAHECSLYEAISSALISDSTLLNLSVAPSYFPTLFTDQVILTKIDRPRSRSPPILTA